MPGAGSGARAGISFGAVLERVLELGTGIGSGTDAKGIGSDEAGTFLLALFAARWAGSWDKIPKRSPMKFARELFNLLWPRRCERAILGTEF